jgi:hypothetical protein
VALTVIISDISPFCLLLKRFLSQSLLDDRLIHILVCGGSWSFGILLTSSLLLQHFVLNLIPEFHLSIDEVVIKVLIKIESIVFLIVTLLVIRHARDS